MTRPARRPSAERRAESLARLAGWLDTRFRIPLTGWRIGLDGLIGLVPGIGDTASAALSAYIVLEGWRIGVRKATLVKMIGNAALDAVVGSVPVLGDAFDIAWKANTRNVALIQRDIASRHR